MTHIERMELEFTELNDKIVKGQEFIVKETNEPKFLDEVQIFLLTEQLTSMFSYREILIERIKYDKIK
ncbi:MAG: crAss001_48 related protein [Fusobacteriaceae bacterium]